MPGVCARVMPTMVTDKPAAYCRYLAVFYQADSSQAVGWSGIQ
ncbi:hypothetical protein TGAM01_v200938 [Trichoderma gamsii]|uniref:Uncharacterized protein n=1 Tax=Trichoderma gamsii TaxID=398673 RepID=A0A2P5A1S9_9HYPO|nr:hypothetical protein TGAM01_v200938 [Trichoderma gamsii]PON30498.1 hypothetical protein TGAM01_v200938 [Trichoderma gamsii]